MADVTLTEEQITTVISISKDVQERVKANGMPELDEEIAEMIDLLEKAVEVRPPPDEVIEGQEAKPLRTVEEEEKRLKRR